MTVISTRNLPGRFAGFLASCMQEVAPGVYAAPRMKASVRTRMWNVLLDWASLVPDDGGLVMVWTKSDAPSGMGMQMIGWPKKELVEYEGVWLTVGALTEQHDVDELQDVQSATDAPFDPDDPTVVGW